MKEDRNSFISLFKAEAALRNLRQAYLIDGRQGRVILAAQGDRIEGYQPPPKEAFKPADMGKMVRIEPTTSGGRRAARR